jgi:hypothetical protein
MERAMKNEHDGYAFTKALRREKFKEAVIDVAIGVVMVVAPLSGGFWLGGFQGAFIGLVLGVGAGLITGFIPFRVEK